MDTETPAPHVDLGERLRTAREIKGLSARELARRVGCSTRSIAIWESGAVMPGGEALRGLAIALGTRVDYILGLEQGKRGAA